MKLKYILLLFISFGILTSCGSSQGRTKLDKDTAQWRYEIEPVNVGVQGTYLVKTWTYSKNPEKAMEQAKKNAVHGIIFRGFAGKNRVPGQKPLADVNAEKKHKEFFKSFFQDGGKYLKFVNISNDGSVAAGDYLKVGKEYKIGVMVSVNVSELRKDLEDANIIKRLNAGF